MLDQTGRRLIQWPIKEIEELRENQVTLLNKELKGGTVIEVQGTISASQVTTKVLPTELVFSLDILGI